ncbi:hypothetical protein BH20ACI4_BH20ACI4_21400 [soil metagenome]
MKRKFFIFTFIVCAVSLIAYSQLKREAFAPAEDFPRGALLYVQIEDLPAFIRLWNESELKKNYLESRNFAEFSNQHLGRKLASRRREFNEAAGFDFDLETVSAFSQTKAALALYDVGKIEFVFIAPVSDVIFTATKLFQNKENFTSETLADGTEIFRKNIEADRGRQKQELIFTHSRDRLIIATSEKLLAQTLNNINGEKSKNRLIDEPDFAALKDKVTTHIATVWANQTALNEDYYFRRYWLMSDVENLKNIRAGIFDFEIGEEKFIEHRRFLLNESENIAPIDTKTAENILSFAPENIPFYQLKTANPKRLDEAVRKTIFTRKTIAENYPKRGYRHYSSDEDYYGYYENLGENFDEAIDETEEDFEIGEDQTKIDFAAVLSPANPRAVLTFAAPEILPAPLFVNFKRAAFFSLNAPQNFDRRLFETAVTREFLNNVTIENSGAELKWETVSENDLPRRKLELPMLGFNVNYVLTENILILTSDEEFLSEILSAEKNANKPDFEFAEMTVINLAEREQAFENIFGEIEGNTASGNFFTGNISSLFDSVKDIKKIEVRKKYLEKIIEEEVSFYK